MGPLLALVAAALVVGGALASPAEMPSVGRGKKRGGLTFTAVEVPHSSGITERVFRGPDPLGALRMVASAFIKYGKDIPSELQDAINAHTKASDTGNTKRSYGSVKAIAQDFDKYFWSPVSIGTPGQSVQLVFDTGSADTWVYGTESPLGDLSKQFRIYDPKKSSSSRLTELTWNVVYAAGAKAGGVVYSDIINVAGITVTGQAIEVPTTLGPEFSQWTAMDGILGLSFRETMKTQPYLANTFMDNAAGTLDIDAFTVDLRFNATGTFSFGVIDENAHDDPITWTPINSPGSVNVGYWDMHITGYSFFGEDLKEFGFDIVVDTGTTLAWLPSQIVKEFYGEFPESRYNQFQGGWAVPCNIRLPDFSFGVKGQEFTVPGEYLKAAQISDEYCLGVIQDSSVLGVTLFGSAFMKAFFFVFNHGGRELGIATKKL